MIKKLDFSISSEELISQTVKDGKKNTNISFKLTKDDLINYNSNYYIKIRLEK